MAKTLIYTRVSYVLMDKQGIEPYMNLGLGENK